MNRLPDGVLERLIKLAGMMTSPFDNERAVAAAKAADLLKRHGLTWADVLAGQQPAPLRPGRHWRTCISDCLTRPGLSAWEREFLTTLRNWRGEPTPKQRARLTAICEAVGVPPPSVR
jgi:hypothetical protein